MGRYRTLPRKFFRRPAEEVAAWKDRDPIPLYHQRLLRLGVAEGDLVNIQQDVARGVDEATEFAKAGASYPPSIPQH